MKIDKILLYAAAICALGVYAIPAKAVTVEGVTYTMANPDDNNFIISITGINTATDTEGGRKSVNAFALSTLNYTITGGTTPGGTFAGGGLNSSGCDGNGGFFCFDVNIPVSGSTLDIPFHLDSANLAGWATATAFKIDWIGSQRNYDLVSLPFGGTPPSSVPLPGAIWLFGAGVLGIGTLMRRQYRLNGQANPLT